jgi:pyruvate dehydrogenase E1 component beta subunit
MGKGGRNTVHFDIPPEGVSGAVPDIWSPVTIGKSAVRREGKDITMVSVGVGVHRALEAAAVLSKKGISAGVLDLRTVSPLDREGVCEAVSQSGRLLVVDEDYRDFGLSGELAAIVLEAGIPVRYQRVCTEGTIPYTRIVEDQVLPNTQRIVDAALRLME